MAVTQELFPLTFGFDSPFSTTTESLAVFGQMEFDITDALTVTAGLRWSNEEKETSFNQYFSLFETPNSNTVALQDSLGIGKFWSYENGRYSNIGAWTFEGGAIPLIEGDAETTIEDDFFTAKLGLDYRLSDDTLLYASYNRGVKAGGFNAPLDATLFAYGALPPENMNFDSETLNAYEVGFKTSFLDGLARLNGAIYYYDYQDYQAFALESLTLYVFNTDAENKGGELELQISPTDRLDILLGLSYIDNNVDDAYTTPGGETLDRRAIMTPEINANGVIRYGWPMAGARCLFSTTLITWMTISSSLKTPRSVSRTPMWFPTSAQVTPRQTAHGMSLPLSTTSPTKSTSRWCLTWRLRRLVVALARLSTSTPTRNGGASASATTGVIRLADRETRGR